MAIEKLKNNPDVLDMTAPPKENNEGQSSKTKETVIDMAPRNKGGNKGRLKVSTSGGTRNRVSVADLKGDETEIHGNPNISKVQKAADSMLSLDDPNSMFNQYYNDKVKEYNERMQEEEEKVRDAVESGELEADSDIAKSWLGDPDKEEKINTVRTADIEFDDDDEEEEVEENITEEIVEEEPIEQPTENIIDPMTEDVPVEEELEDDSYDLGEEEVEEDDEEEYDDEEIDLSDDIEDEEEEIVENDKPLMTVDNKKEEKKEKASKLRGVDIAISSKKSDLKDDDEEEETTNPQNDELVNKLRKMATEKLKPKTAAIDISNFAIGKASVKNINPVISVKENKIAKWVLINQEQVVLMREFSGVDLQTFVETSNVNNASNFSRRMRLLYNHIESPKPSTFETWLKSTPYSDLDHYYFGVYVASFNGANYMPIDCAGGTKCPEGTFVSDDVPIMDLVKFNKDEVKSKFKKIYKEETTVANPDGKFVYNIVPVNNSIAVGFKEPMLYDFIETISVDDTFARKYGSVINMVPYINDFYIINQKTGTLDPIGYNEFPGNAAKTFRSKIRKYNTLLSYLTSDEYALIEAYANDIRDRDDGITYITPSLTCPYCGTESEEAEMTAETLVFTRYQLGALVNTTLK